MLFELVFIDLNWFALNVHLGGGSADWYTLKFNKWLLKTSYKIKWHILSTHTHKWKTDYIILHKRKSYFFKRNYNTRVSQKFSIL